MGKSTASRHAFDIDETASFANPGMGFSQVERINYVPAVLKNMYNMSAGGGGIQKAW